MRRTLLGLLLTTAFVLVAVPLFFRNWNSDQPTPGPHAASYEHAPHREAVFKQKIVQSDMEATEKLARSQTLSDMRRYLSKGECTMTELKKLMQLHPEMRQLEWTDGKQSHVAKAAEVAPSLKNASSPYFEAGRNAVKLGNPYTSPLFTDQGKSYYVMAQSAGDARGGLVSLISSEVIQAVERHQRRNMRLIPYPAEGRYRIESVTPNTLHDTTVRTGEDNGNASHYAVDEVVVKFRQPLNDAQLLDLRKSLDLVVIRQTRHQTYVFRSKKHKTEELISYFKANWNPIYVEPHYLYMTNELPDEPVTDQGAFVPNDTLYSEYQWNLPQIATESGWSVSKGSKDIVVAVIDTGVQADHPDLQGRLVEGVNIVDPSSPPDDDVGHGTHVAGIISAAVNNGEGVAGMTWYTKIMPVKALDSTGAGSTYSVAEGVLWAVDHGANVINMSLGNYAQAEFLHDALKYAYDHGVVLVAASGNDNTDRPGFPAAYPEVLAVAATNPDKTRAEYSNYGDYIDIAAPGTNIPSTYPGSRYAALSGTSMASPHVAALASLVRAVNPQLSNEEVMDVLRRTARDLGAQGKDNDFGYGEIDVKSALQSVSGASTSLQLYPRQVRRQLERLNAE